jgi:hypothetical protein
MQCGLRCKFFILLEFFADSSWQRGYGHFLEILAFGFQLLLLQTWLGLHRL